MEGRGRRMLFFFFRHQLPSVAKSKRTTREIQGDKMRARAMQLQRIPGIDWKRKPLSAARSRQRGSRFFFGLERLGRHYLPPVAASGEKDESEVRKSRTVQKG